ncbi:MAG: inorganic pyrophosphatase [Anaerolineales bacterium]|nr:inorganic pyrophosphatase [Anaerolineae bacterium]PWB52371.1 MAG: inorganic pyrophosphatase [Anaerolineales bacterium]
MKDEFWVYLQQLVDTSEIIVDRPKGSIHHRYPTSPYPFDYGYLKGTTSADGAEIDIWIGTLGKKEVVGVLCTVDLLKRDTELKVLCDCTSKQVEAILDFINQGQMRGIMIPKDQQEGAEQ